MDFQITESLFWLIVAVSCGIVEALTLGITSIWFLFGALVAWLLAQLNAPLIFQLIAFIIVSVVLLYFTRPILKNKLKVGKHKTNTDLLIGEIGVVIEEIDTMNTLGQVMVKGQVWSAKTKEGKIIKKDSKVEILSIEGVKLVVKNIEEEI